MTNTPLKDAFAPADEVEWHALVAKALGDAPFTSLKTALYEGFKTEPLYSRAEGEAFAHASGVPGAAPFIRGAQWPVSGGRPWTVLQLLDHLDIAEANRQLREDLAGGASGVWLQTGGDIAYGGALLGARTLDRLEDVFDGVDLAGFPVYLSAGRDAPAAAALLMALAERRGVPPERLAGSAGFDPLAVIAASGRIPIESEAALADEVDAALGLRARGAGLIPFRASGRLWHQAGGSAVEELALTLAAAVTYWRALAAAGMPVAQAARLIGMHLVADADMFIGIGKFRAARALWARATEAAGIGAQPMPLSAEMSFRMLAARDPYVNLLRASAATFAAALGGVEAILLIPFTAAQGTPDAFARRLARNTQLVLQDEAFLGKVSDPAGGSWYVESLTHSLAARAWALFRQIEAEGGLLAALRAGSLRRMLRALCEQRAEALAKGRDRLTGVSAFPDIDEKPAPVFADQAIRLDTVIDKSNAPLLPEPAQGARFDALVAAARDGATLDALGAAFARPSEPCPAIPDPAERAGEDFELLRDAADRAVTLFGTRPSIFLANLGPLAEFSARATWVKNMFEAGGLAVLGNDGFDSVETLAQAFRESGALLVCICGSDERYAAMPGVAEALKQFEALAVYLAGGRDVLAKLDPADKRAIDGLLYQGCDMLSVLKDAHALLRVEDMIRMAEAPETDFDEYAMLEARERGAWFLR